MKGGDVRWMGIHATVGMPSPEDDGHRTQRGPLSLSRGEAGGEGKGRRWEGDYSEVVFFWAFWRLRRSLRLAVRFIEAGVEGA